MTTDQLMLIDPSTLKVVGDNIRRDLGDLTELAASIKQVGILQPPKVRLNAAGEHEVVFGHRRVAAAQLAGVDEIPVLLAEYDERDRRIAMLTENLQREDLAPLEEAEAYRCLVDEFGMKQRDIAELGTSQARVSKRMALLKLPDSAKAALDSKRISLSDAEQLTKIKDAKVVDKIARAVTKGGTASYAIDTALRAQERSAKVAKARAELKKAGLEELKDRAIYSPPEGKEWRRPRDGEEATHATIDGYSGNVYPYVLVDIDDQRDDEDLDDDDYAYDDEGERLPDDVVAVRKAEHEAAAKALEARRQLEHDAAATRREFIEVLVGGSRVDSKPVHAHLAAWLVHDLTSDHYDDERDLADVASAIGVPVDDPADTDAIAADLKSFAIEGGPAGTLRVALASVLLAAEENIPGHQSSQPWRRPTWRNCDEVVVAHFAFLEAAGYVLSEVEHAGLAEVAEALAATAQEVASREVEPPTIDADRFIRENDVRDGDEVLDGNVVQYDPTIRPWDSYDNETVEDVCSELSSTGIVPGLLRRVVAYEQANGNRGPIIAKATALLEFAAGVPEPDHVEHDAEQEAAEPWPGYSTLDPDQPEFVTDLLRHDQGADFLRTVLAYEQAHLDRAPVVDHINALLQAQEATA